MKSARNGSRSCRVLAVPGRSVPGGPRAAQTLLLPSQSAASAASALPWHPLAFANNSSRSVAFGRVSEAESLCLPRALSTVFPRKADPVPGEGRSLPHLRLSPGRAVPVPPRSVTTETSRRCRRGPIGLRCLPGICQTNSPGRGRRGTDPKAPKVLAWFSQLWVPLCRWLELGQRR